MVLVIVDSHQCHVVRRPHLNPEKRLAVYKLTGAEVAESLSTKYHLEGMSIVFVLTLENVALFDNQLLLLSFFQIMR